MTNDAPRTLLREIVARRIYDAIWTEMEFGKAHDPDARYAACRHIYEPAADAAIAAVREWAMGDEGIIRAERAFFSVAHEPHGMHDSFRCWSAAIGEALDGEP